MNLNRKLKFPNLDKLNILLQKKKQSLKKSNWNIIYYCIINFNNSNIDIIITKINKITTAPT